MSSTCSIDDSTQKSAWNDSILVQEYEARVEPFTSLFVGDMLKPFLEAQKNTRKGSSQKDPTAPTLLDVGCGPGFASIRASENGFHVTATDASKAMVDRTQERAVQNRLESYVECILADGQNLSSVIDLGSRQFDYAVAAFSVIFFPDPLKGLKEIYKCLSDNGGKVVLSAWGSTEETPAFQVFQDALQIVIPNHAGEKSKPNRITGSPAVLQSLLDNAGFRDIEIVGPISHNVHVASPQEFYNRFALTCPKLRAVLRELEQGEREAVKQKVMELAEARGGRHQDGSISIPSMAYFAYGTKNLNTIVQ